jgi:hypothetical protein
MRAFVRVLPLFAAAALVAACGATHVARSDAGAASLAAPVSVVDPALLARQPPPQCELAKPPEDIGANDARVVTLDYERQCYKQLTDLERARVVALQDAVARLDRGLDRRLERASRHRGLLESVPLPECALANPPENVSPNEARAATLDYERQCYRHLAAIERAKIAALQDAVRHPAAAGASHTSATY